MALNLPLINEFARQYAFEPYSDWNKIEEYCAMANMPKPAVPIAVERVLALREAAEAERARQKAEQREIERIRKEIDGRGK